MDLKLQIMFCHFTVFHSTLTSTYIFVGGHHYDDSNRANSLDSTRGCFLLKDVGRLFKTELEQSKLFRLNT